MTGPTGNVISRHDYLAFGYDMATNYGRGNTGLPNSGWGQGDGVPQLYTGQMQDPETQFDWFRTRYYTRIQGRFHSPDPFNAGVDLTNPQSWNGYAYVNNSPLSNADPWGLGDCPGLCASLSNPGQGSGNAPAGGGGSSGGGFTIWQSSSTPPRAMTIQSNEPVLGSFWYGDQKKAVISISPMGEPNTIIIRPQGYNRVSQYEYGPNGMQQYRYDWGDPHGGDTTDPHLHVIDWNRPGKNPSGKPIDVPSYLAPRQPWRPDGPYSTYPKGAPPIFITPTIPVTTPLPVCITCNILMHFNSFLHQETPAWF